MAVADRSPTAFSLELEWAKGLLRHLDFLDRFRGRHRHGVLVEEGCTLGQVHGAPRLYARAGEWHAKPPHHRFTQVELFRLTLCEALAVDARRTRWRLRSAEAGATSPLVVATRAVDGRDGCGRSDAPLLKRTEDCHSQQRGGGTRLARRASAPEASSTGDAASTTARGCCAAGLARGAAVPGAPQCPGAGVPSVAPPVGPGGRRCSLLPGGEGA